MNQKSGGLDHWLPLFAAARLPLLSEPAALTEMRGDAVSLQEIHQYLLADPPLALALILHAETIPRIAGEVQGLLHAVNVLGVGRIQSVIAGQADLLMDAGQATHQACLEAIAVSHLASELVRAWQPEHLLPQAEFLQWVAVLQGVARWKLPLVAPELHQAIEQGVRRGERRGVLERAMLGCELDRLNAALMLANGLPEDTLLLHAVRPDTRMLAQAARYAWTGRMAPELPLPVARWLRQRTTASVLAHMIAWAAHDDWYGPRMQLLMRVLSASLNHPLDEIVAQTHEVAVEASRAPHLSGRCQSIAERLFWPPLPPRSLGRSVPTAAVATGAEAAGTLADSSGSQPVPFRHVVESFTLETRESRHEELAALWQGLRRAIERGLRLRRCLVFLRERQGDVLSCVFAHGFGPAVDVASLTLALPQANTPHLLGRMMACCGALWVTPEKLLAVRPQLPENLRHLAPAGGMLLATLAHEKVPQGVIWVDAGDDGLPLIELQYRLFRLMSEPLAAAYLRLGASD